MKTWMIAALLLLLCGCDDQGLPPDDSLKPAVSVEFQEASCTEAWLRLVTRNVSPPYTVTLLRNDSAVATFSSPPADTTVIDEGLAPFRTYTYRARLTSPSGLNLTGDPVQARTLDTTSHQFAWETTVLGDGGANVFYDVAIVNDTLAYAVGEVYLRDSSGVLDPRRYNMARWNGETWRVQRVPYNYQGQNFYHPIQTVIAFGPDDIWFAGNGVVRWDGRQFLPMPLPLELWGPYRVNRMWGTSARNVYIVGDGGSIAHFDGITWRRVESGTTIRLLDIWGTSDGGQIWSCGWHQTTGENIVLRRQSDQWQVVTLPPGITQGELLGTLWMKGRMEVLLTGSGDVFRQSLVSPYFIRRDPVNLGAYAYRIRGTESNDVVLVGDYAMVWTWNGMRWQHHRHLENSSDRLRGVAITSALHMAVGTRLGGGVDNLALVIMGRR